MSCTQINKLRAVNSALGLKDTEAGYWTTTPGEGTGGLWGSEIFGVHGCEFKLARTTTEVRSGECGKHQWVWSKVAAGQFNTQGGYWWDSNGGTGAYGWFMGHGNQGDHGTGSTCHATGQGLGYHTGTWAPFHRGWCAVKSWGVVFAR